MRLAVWRISRVALSHCTHGPKWPSFWPKMATHCRTIHPRNARLGNKNQSWKCQYNQFDVQMWVVRTQFHFDLKKWHLSATMIFFTVKAWDTSSKIQIKTPRSKPPKSKLQDMASVDACHDTPNTSDSGTWKFVTKALRFHRFLQIYAHVSLKLVDVKLIAQLPRINRWPKTNNAKDSRIMKKASILHVLA